VNLARLNHVLLPATADERDRWRRRPLVRLMAPLAWFYFALSEEGRALSLLTLFVGSAAVDVGRTQVHLLWAALIGLLGGAVLVRRGFAMPAARLEAVVPARLIAGEVITIELLVVNRGDQPLRNVRLRRPFLPWDGTWVGRAPVVSEVLPGASARVRTRARFTQRGPHHLDPFLAAQVAPLGLSVGPHVESETTRFMVLPRPVRVDALGLAGRPPRARHGRRASTALDADDLAGVRPYRSGDPVRLLHARTWAHTGQPHVRELQREARSRLAIVLDAAEPVRSEAAFEAAVSVAAGLLMRAARSDGVVEVAVLGDGFRSIAVGRGIAASERALDLLASVEPGRRGDIRSLSRWLDARVGGLSGVYLVSAVPRPELSGALAALSQRGLAVRPVWVLARRALGTAPADGRTVCVEDLARGGRLSL
jgi:uncharacterized protein (DUF58 family)